MKTFNTQVCTTKAQSQRLLELGLNVETADCNLIITKGEHVAFIGKTKIDCSKVTINGHEINRKKIIHIPAWSLHRLISICEHGITINHYENVVTYNMCRDFYGLETIYDNVIDCIEYLIKEGFLNKEYLEE